MKIKHLHLSVGTPPKKKIFLLRQAVVEDVQQIISISQSIENFRMSEFTRSGDEEELLYWISSQSSIVVVASTDSILIGYGYGHCLSPKWFFFDEFGVSADFRNMGVGKEMYIFLRDECRSQGFHLIQGIVKDNQHGSLDYWIKLGFEDGSKCTWVEDWLDEE